MSSKEEIKSLFIAELKNTPQYTEVLNIKQKIIDEINEPKVQKYVRYTFSVEQTNEELEVVKMCMMVEFGFSTDNLNNQSILIDMIKFLE